MCDYTYYYHYQYIIPVNESNAAIYTIHPTVCPSVRPTHRPYVHGFISWRRKKTLETSRKGVSVYRIFATNQKLLDLIRCISISFCYGLTLLISFSCFILLSLLLPLLLQFFFSLSLFHQSSLSLYLIGALIPRLHVITYHLRLSTSAWWACVGSIHEFCNMRVNACVCMCVCVQWLVYSNVSIEKGKFTNNTTQT